MPIKVSKYKIVVIKAALLKTTRQMEICCNNNFYKHSLPKDKLITI